MSTQKEILAKRRAARLAGKKNASKKKSPLPKKSSSGKSSKTGDA